jgi:type I restriction enzyme, S subunit
MTKQWAHKALEELLALNRSGYWGDETPSKARPIEVKVIRNADLTKHNSIKGSATRYFSAKEAANAELQIGDIAMSSSGDVGKAWLINEPGYSASNFIRILRPDANYIVPGFLRYVLESDQGQAALKASTAGTTIQNLQKTFYSMLTVPLPPLAEQQRIVRLLDEAFEGVAIAKANAEKNLQNAKALFESQIEKVLSNGGIGWMSEQLGQVCEIERGGSPRPIQQFLTSDPAGVNWIKIGDATASGKYIYKTEEKIRAEGVKRSRMVYEGDFILSNSMSFGRPYIMKTTGCIHDGWLVLRKPSVNADFLYHALSSKVVFNQFDKLAAGSTVRNLNIGLAKSVWIPIPPLAEQIMLAKKFDELQAETDVLSEVASRKVLKLNELGSAILHEAFSGNRKAA